MSSLIGVNFPLNSVGVIPHKLLSLPNSWKSNNIYTNAKEIFALTERYHGTTSFCLPLLFLHHLLLSSVPVLFSLSSSLHPLFILSFSSLPTLCLSLLSSSPHFAWFSRSSPSSLSPNLIIFILEIKSETALFFKPSSLFVDNRGYALLKAIDGFDSDGNFSEAINASEALIKECLTAQNYYHTYVASHSLLSLMHLLLLLFFLLLRLLLRFFLLLFLLLLLLHIFFFPFAFPFSLFYSLHQFVLIILSFFLCVPLSYFPLSFLVVFFLPISPPFPP